ncbi:hypothetical protein XA68_13385 [Ophiocordyceps unilateralis]|uniref:Uncharacterized protein n=1 Tax=Ophiocordyceps unilateralis TaxID=268505 RepID=A0A2A9PNK7_OPHUN|nr:hypothetical protein XA68_13385 [Ophiocordyceps unilateralis]
MASQATQPLKSHQLFDVSHVTAVLTGGGSGIGLMITQALVANGAKVYVVERRKDALDTVVRLYNTGPGEIIPIVADISIKEEVVRLAEQIRMLEKDGIQLLVNNAGIALDHATRFAENGQPRMTDAQSISEHFMRSTPSDWTRSFETNVMGGFFMSMALLPLLDKGCCRLKGYSSSIINLSSNSAFLKDSCRGYISYSASKAGTVHLSRILATLLSKTNVRVNQIAPGTFPSEMTTGSSGPDQKSTMNRPVMNAAGRAGEETDIAATVLFLASVGGGFYNHQILFPDGGETLIGPAAI